MATAARAAFRRDWDAATTSWQALVGAHTAYTSASDDIAGIGVLGSHGLDWQPGQPGGLTNIESVTAAQRVDRYG